MDRLVANTFAYAFADVLSTTDPIPDFASNNYRIEFYLKYKKEPIAGKTFIPYVNYIKSQVMEWELPQA